MFGDDSGTTAYAKLALFDTNQDNKIDSADTGFATLKIWQDLDSDGKTDAGELKTLAASGITNLSLQTSTATTLNGHAIAGTSTFTRTNGTIGNAADVLFFTNQVDSIYVGSDTSAPPALDLSTLFMPLYHGYGNLPALHYAMTENPILKTMVEDLGKLNIATQMHEVYGRINNIILEWAGATNIAVTGAETDRNAQKIAVLQKFLGRDIIDPIVNGYQERLNVDEAYSSLFNDFTSKILAQGLLHSVFPKAEYLYTHNVLVPNQTLDEVITQAKALAPTNALQKFVYWAEIHRILGDIQNSMNSFDYLDYNQKIEEAAGFSVLPPVIMGTSGNDILTLGDPDNLSKGFVPTVLQGFAGNDIFHVTNDARFIYNIGDGADTVIRNSTVNSITMDENGMDDTILEWYRPSSIYFGPGITFSSLTFSHNNIGLLIEISGGGSIQFDSKYFVNELYFNDGTEKNYTDINYRIYGGVGTDDKDILYGTIGNNSMYGKGGDDNIYAAAGDDTIYGGTGNDRIYASDGNDTVFGEDGNDGLYGGSGVDYIDGGTGNDTALYSDSTTAVTIDLSKTSAQIGGNAQGDILINIENVIGTYYDDMFIGNKNANGFNGTPDPYSSYYMSAGNDTVSYANSDAGVTVSLGFESHQQISGGYADGDVLVGISNLIGSIYNDTLIGDDRDNLLTGGTGNDKLYGSTGDDTLTGGAGSDVFAINKSPNSTGIITDFNVAAVGEAISLLGFSNPVDFAHLNFTQSGNDTIINLEENQKIILKNVVYSTLKAANFDSNSIINGTDLNDVMIGTPGNDTIKALAGDDKIYSDEGSDIIDGGTGVDTIYYGYSYNPIVVDLSIATGQIGGDADGDIISNIENVIGTRGNDVIIGNSANNLLIGGAGADRLDGGAGIDTVSYLDSKGSVLVNLQNTSQSWADASGDTLFNIENIIGSNSLDVLTGNAGNNIISGMGGNDEIVGGAGADVIDGGAGIDKVVYAASASGVTVDIASTVAQIGGDAQGDILSNIEDITGTSFDDILKGNDLANRISAGGGNNIVYGRGGDDVILVGDIIGGNDTFYGDAGNDELYGSVGDDMLIGGSGADVLYGGSDTDTVSYADSTAAVNVNLGITTAQSGGDAAGDILAAADIENLIGSAYNDTLAGSSLYNKIDGGAGIDTMSYSNSTAAVIVNLGVTTAQSGGYADGDTLFNIENIIGSAYNDILTGSSVANRIDGNSGADTVSYANSTAAVSINLGITTAQTGGDSTGDTLFNVENIIGSAYNDTLLGDTFANTITGGAGADNIDGAAGIDTVSYSDSTAAVNINLGITTAQSGGYAAGDILANIENITGSKYNDILTGNSIANSIDGGSGTDTVSYSNSTAAVTVNLGVTTAQSGGYAAGDILANIENITGSVFADILTGNTGNNIIIGGAGADNLDGSTGIDTVSYASSTAAVVVNLGITTAQSGGDAQGDILVNIESILGSAYNDTLTGNSVANKIDGGSGTDTVSYINSTAAVTVNLGVTTAQTGGYAAGDTLFSIENLIGSAYNDTLKGNSGNNIITGGVGADRIDGSTGTDTVSYVTSAAGVNVNLGVTTAQAGGDAAGDTLVSIESIIGSAYSDTFTSGSVANKIDGSSGIDTVSYAGSSAAVTVNLAATTAQAGGYAAGDTLVSIENIIGSSYNDTLTGSSVANKIDGGSGIDTVSYANSTVAVNVNLAVTTAQVGGHAAGDTLFNIENIIGSSYNDTLTGSSVANKIDGGSGIDTVSYAGSNAAVNVNLAVTTAQVGGHAAGDTLFNIENIIGSSYNDTLKGTSIANIINGGLGNDTMTGGSGADVFKYSTVTDSGKAAGARDIITDFVKGSDKIDLGDFAGTFAFKGTGALGGSVPGVNYAQVSGNTIIGIDADGNGTLDMQIELTGLHTLAASDFLL